MTLLTVVTDRRRSPLPLPELCRAAAKAGADFIQVREKDLEGRALCQLVAEVIAAVAGSAARVLVNGCADVALAAGAYGVQLPEDGLPVADVKQAFPGLFVGASRHDAAGARRAAREGADFVLLGPVFATPGKEARALGAGALAAAAREAGVPVHAIGGIDPSTAAAAVKAGAAGVAAIRPFLQDAGGGVGALRAALAAASA
ncbi:MAG TPA: thiamine phosphate synthase [Vicinamibacteria bacterium]|nr:thiamine phosphate synthase [Vicinamibacteria bacterium]